MEILSFPWDFSADFGCFLVGFLVVFQRIFRAEKEKVAAILCARLCENQIFTTTTKNEGATLDPPYSGAGKPQGGKPP